MFELRPQSEEMMSYYRKRVVWHTHIADHSWPRPAMFSAFTFDELKRLITPDAVLLVQAITRLGNFSDLKSIRERKKAIDKQLKLEGFKLKRGKRTNAGMLEMVAQLTPVLLYFGLPLAFSERSRLVRALRLIANEVGISGDPRDELRRLQKIERKIYESTHKMVLKAVLRGLSFDDGDIDVAGSGLDGELLLKKQTRKA